MMHDREHRVERKEKGKKGESVGEDEGKGMPMIVMHDRKSKYMAAEILTEEG